MGSGAAPSRNCRRMTLANECLPTLSKKADAASGHAGTHEATWRVRESTACDRCWNCNSQWIAPSGAHFRLDLYDNGGLPNMRTLALLLTALSLVSCSRDPNYLKQKYLQSGMKYYDVGRYKEANIMFRKSIEADRKFGPAYYHLALTDLKQNQVAPSVGMLRRAVELLKPGTDDADDALMKLSEIIIVGAQGQENNEALVKEVQH